MRPGINVTTLTAPPNATQPVNTGTWFVAGITSQGPTGAQLVTSFQQFTQVYGGRGTVPTLYDSADTFFKEGGARMYVARVCGPAATAANITLKDAGNANSLIVSAIGPGAYANGYKIVVAGTPSSYTIQVQDSSGNSLETSNTLTSNADAVAYGQTSQYVTIASAGANSPAAGTFTLAGGNDDVNNVTTTQYTNALATFVKDFGPGQVSVPGVSTSAVLTALFQHASSFNRIALGDLADVSTATQSSSAAASTLTSAASPIRALGTVARAGGLFAPWIDVQPVAGSSGLRSVPPSPFVAAKCAVVDATTDPGTGLSNPNIPAAGVNGVLGTAVDLHATFADSDRQSLNDAGVNIIKTVGQTSVRVYGFRTVASKVTDPQYWQLNNARLDMAIIALAGVIQEDYVFSQIDGQGLDAARYGNDLKDMLTGFYTLGALYGDSPQDAFTVDTGSDVNTPTSEAGGTLAATIACRRSPEAEQVNLNIVRVDITQTV